MIAPPEVRQAKATLAKHRKALKVARPARVIPTAQGQRQPRVRDPKYLQWIRRLPCVACAVEPLDNCGPVQAAHLRMATPGKPNPGLQSKPDDIWTTPLGALHHLTQHKGHEREFWGRLNIDPMRLCQVLRAYYDADADGAEVIRRFAVRERTR